MATSRAACSFMVMPPSLCYYCTIRRGCQVAGYFRKSKLPDGVGAPETRMLSEYLLTKFPTYRAAIGFPVGPEIGPSQQLIGQGKRLAVSRPWRPEVDALVWFDGVLLLIEAKVMDYFSGLGKLPLYKALIPTTPELAEWRSWEVRMRLVVPRARPWLNSTAEAVGAEIDLFDPPWLRDYYDYRDQYWTAAYRTQRQQVLDARRAAGLE